MELTKKALIEGVLFGSPSPIKANVLAELLEIELEDLKNLIGELQEEYAQENRGLWLVMVAGGYQLRTKPELRPVMAKFFEKKPARLTQAMLETLAIVAYKQPVTRPEIDRIRGVDSSGALKTLLERELVEMRGRSETVGNPVLYGTTPKFLEWFQIGNLGDLPPLSEMEALQSIGEEGSEHLLNLLNQDEGFANADLNDLDESLLEVARSQRKLDLEVHPKTEESEQNNSVDQTQEASADQSSIIQEAADSN